MTWWLSRISRLVGPGSRICNNWCRIGQQASESSALMKEARMYEVLQKRNIAYYGRPGEDPKAFLSRLNESILSLRLTDEEVLRALPYILFDQADNWRKVNRADWSTYGHFVQAFREEYGIDDYQARLRQEIERRTQGPNELIANFITNLRLLMNQVVPPWPIDKAAQNSL